jgi:hypothetical protein
MYINAKMIPDKTIPRMRKVGLKDSSGGGEFKYDIYDLL